MKNKDIIDEYINKATWKIKENSNETYSLSGLQSYIAGELLAEDYINKSPVGELHTKKRVHIHDSKFGEFSPYCNGLDIYKLLSMGLINPKGASSRPAKHFDTLMSQMVNMLYISQQEFAGAQAFGNVDTMAAPFIAKDNLDYAQVKQIIQRTVYDINYPLRSSYQTPFINFSFDIICPEYMKNEGVIIGGELQENTYADYQTEMDLFNTAFINVMMEGNMGKPFTFPIPTIAITPDFPWDSLVVDKLFKLTAKFGSPYFSNFLGSGLDSSTTRSMCCRLSLNIADLDKILDNSRRGLWNMGASTGSLAVTTVNLPQLGYRASKQKNPEDFFFKELDYLLEKCYDHHEWKREKCEWALKNGLLPFTMNYLRSFDTYFSTLGTIGCEEMCQNMFNEGIHKHSDFTVKVLEFMSEKGKEFTHRSGHLYNLEEIPAEGLCYSFALHDSQKYPGIYTQGEKDNVYYTNSSHSPVSLNNLSIIDDILIQNKFKPIYTGGTLQHLFIGEAAPNSEGVKDLIRNLCNNTKLPYIAFTKSFAVCEICGLSDDLSGVCPTCGEEIPVFSRVTGYYREISSFNKGKSTEFKDRKQHQVDDFGK